MLIKQHIPEFSSESLSQLFKMEVDRLNIIPLNIKLDSVEKPKHSRVQENRIKGSKKNNLSTFIFKISPYVRIFKKIVRFQLLLIPPLYRLTVKLKAYLIRFITTKTYQIGDFFFLLDTDFINEAYFVILGKNPESTVVENYLIKLRQGGWNRLNILKELCKDSKERENNIRIKGLTLRLLLSRFSKKPIVGYFASLMHVIIDIPDLVKEKEIIKSRLSDFNSEMRDAYARFDKQFKILEGKLFKPNQLVEKPHKDLEQRYTNVIFQYKGNDLEQPLLDKIKFISLVKQRTGKGTNRKYSHHLHEN